MSKLFTFELQSTKLKMKKLLFKLLVVTGLFTTSIAFNSCEEKTGLTFAFNQDNTAIMTILPNSNLRIDTTRILTSNLDSLLQANNATREDIEEVTLASINVDLCDSLGVVYPSGVNFNEWDSVGVRVFVPNDNTIPDVLVASASVPRNLIGFGVGLTQSDFDFLPYAEKNQFAVRLLNKLNTAITTKKYVKVTVRVNIVANI